MLRNASAAYSRLDAHCVPMKTSRMTYAAAARVMDSMAKKNWLLFQKCESQWATRLGISAYSCERCSSCFEFFGMYDPHPSSPNRKLTVYPTRLFARACLAQSHFPRISPRPPQGSH